MQGPRRILLVVHSFLPDSHAGVERYSLRLGLALQERGHIVSLVAGRLRPGRAQASLAEDRVDGLRVLGIVQNWPRRGGRESWDDPAIDRAFGEVLRRERPDLVAFQSLQGLSLGMVAAAKDYGARVAWHLHDAHAVCAAGGQRLRGDGGRCEPVDIGLCEGCFARWAHPDGPLERWGRGAAGRMPPGLPPDLLHRLWLRLPARWQDPIRGWNDGRRPMGSAPRTLDPDERRRRFGSALRAADCRISPSRFLAESLRRDAVDPGVVTVVPTGVPTPPPGPAVLAHGGPLRLLFLGGWLPHKGPQVLAAALAGLSAPEAEGVEAVGVGPAPGPSFREEVLRIARGRLQDGGLASPGQVDQRLAWADVVVVPSIWEENAPLVVLEARAAGRPVLASDGGGLPELVDSERDGWLVDRGVVAAWRDRIRSLVADPGAVRARAAALRPVPSVEDWVEAIWRCWWPA